MSKKIILNLSGHPLREDQIKVKAKFVLLSPVGQSGGSPAVDPDKVRENAQGEIVKEAERLLSQYIEDIKANNVLAIIPPGLSTLAIGVIAFYHGVAGHFPKILTSVRNTDGEFEFYELDPQQIREYARTIRVYPVHKVSQ